jgi:preprotein translocase subunit SecG
LIFLHYMNNGTITLILNILQIISAVLLVAAILLQARGSGLGSVFGGEGNIFRTKRGLDKILFYFTIVVAVIFFGTATANVLL